MYSNAGLSRWHSGKESACQCKRHKRHGFNLWVGKSPWSEKWQPAPVFLPVKSLEQRRLEGYSPWGEKELDTTDRLTPSLSHFPVLLISSLAITSTLKWCRILITKKFTYLYWKENAVYIFLSGYPWNTKCINYKWFLNHTVKTVS